MGAPRTHGMAANDSSGFSRKYRCWKSMKCRCTTPGPHDQMYIGVTLYPPWREWLKFDKDMPDPPSEQHTLDRIKNKLGYEPGNVRWATRAEQSRNKSDTVKITLNGKTQSQAEWCRELGMDWRTVTTRRRRGWSNERALLTPVDVTKRNRRAK